MYNTHNGFFCLFKEINTINPNYSKSQPGIFYPADFAKFLETTCGLVISLLHTRTLNQGMPRKAATAHAPETAVEIT